MKQLIFFLFLPAIVMAGTPKSKIFNNFENRLNPLHNEQTWREFVKQNNEVFPEKVTEKPSVIVKKEILTIDGDTITIGVSYRQNLVKADFQSVKDFMTTPWIFRYAYGFDKDSNTPTNPKQNPQTGTFQARIYKKLPALADQDYTLKYISKTYPGLFIIRAPLVKDASNFAVRDNLKVLEETTDGVIIREINMIYPLKWYVRAMGAQVRSITKSEVFKVAVSENCVITQAKKRGISKALAEECWEKASN